MNHQSAYGGASLDLTSFVRKFERRGRPLAETEISALRGAISQVIRYDADQDIVREHEYKNESNLQLSGWTYRYSDLADGRRQILALHVAGDFVDLHSFQLKRMDHSVRTATPCVIAIVPHENLTRLTETHPHLTRQLWFNTLMDAAIMRRWMVGLGQRSAVANAAHLFCEMYHRCHMVGLERDGSYEFPLNQTELGEALGISPVHTNRVLQELRAEGVLPLPARRRRLWTCKAWRPSPRSMRPICTSARRTRPLTLERRPRRSHFLRASSGRFAKVLPTRRAFFATSQRAKHGLFRPTKSVRHGPGADRFDARAEPLTHWGVGI